MHGKKQFCFSTFYSNFSKWDFNFKKLHMREGIIFIYCQKALLILKRIRQSNEIPNKKDSA